MAHDEITELSVKFLDYLKSGRILRSPLTYQFAAGLTDAGFTLEAQALEACSRGTSELSIGSGPWRGKMLNLSPKPPTRANVGDLWFDRTEVVAMVYVLKEDGPNPDMPMWLAVRPVATWQFEAFRLASAGKFREKIQWPSADDFLSHPVNTDPRGYVGGIYHDEAFAYTLWFGKMLVGQSDWQDARDTISVEVLDHLLPTGRLAWDGEDFALSEFVRVAIGQETLDKDTYDEYMALGETMGEDRPDRTVFSEWERLDRIGFSTMFDATAGLALGPPRSIFFVFQNSASRIDGYSSEEMRIKW